MVKRVWAATALLLMGCHGASGPVCPEEMVLVQGGEGPFCMHRYEVHFEGGKGNRDQGIDFPDGTTRGTVHARQGLTPTTAISWYQAYAACAASGMHLCTSLEWEDACDGKPGAGGLEFGSPDGKFRLGECAISDVEGLERYPLSPSGSFPNCHSAAGVFDLHGNVWEWVDPGKRSPDGRPVIDKRGGGHYTGERVRCAFSAVGTHTPDFDGTIGFRCCMKPRSGAG